MAFHYGANDSKTYKSLPLQIVFINPSDMDTHCINLEKRTGPEDWSFEVTLPPAVDPVHLQRPLQRALLKRSRRQLRNCWTPVWPLSSGAAPNVHDMKLTPEILEVIETPGVRGTGTPPS